MSYLQSQENYAWAYFDNQWELTSLLTPGAKNKKENYLSPVAIIDFCSDKLITNQEIILSAESSCDDNGFNLEYLWYCEDFLESEEANLKITFSQAGLKKIKLKVVNQANLEDETTIYLNIEEENDSEITEDSLTKNEKNPEFICQDFNKEIIINEILPNPSGTDDTEWIELFNPGTKKINLTNWQIADNSSSYILKEEINAKDYLLIPRSASKIALNNSNEEIKLFDCQKNLIWELSYAKSFENQSYAYDQYTETYLWTEESTPGQKNTIEIKLTNNSTEENFLNNENADFYFAEMAEIFDLENNQEIITYGIVTALPNELYLNTAYLCSYDIHLETTYLDNCLGIYLKDGWPKLNYGDIIQVQGIINHLKYYPRLKISEPEKIIKIKPAEIPEIEKCSLEDLDETMLNFLIAVSGKISKLNKKSLYLQDDEQELKIKLNNDEIDLSDLEKGDNLIIRGLLINYQDKLTLIPRNQDDIVESEVLAESEINLSATSSEIINLNTGEKETPQTLNWILGSGFLTSLGFVFKSKIIQLFKK